MGIEFVPAQTAGTTEGTTMSTSERLFRTFAVVPAAIFDFTKTLSNGGTVQESFNEVGNKMEETMDANSQMIRDGFKEFVNGYKENPALRVAAPWVSLFMNE
jgi:hypothetical protein